MGDEVTNIDFSIPAYKTRQNDSSKDEDLQEIEEPKPLLESSDKAKALAYSSPGQSREANTSSNPVKIETNKQSTPDQRLTSSIIKLEQRIQAERIEQGQAPIIPSQNIGFANYMERSSPHDAIRFSINQSQNSKQSDSLIEKTRQNELVLTEAKRLQGLGRTEDAQKLIDNPGRGNAFVRITDLRRDFTVSLDANTQEITTVQTALDELTQSREQLDPFTKRSTNANYTRQKEITEDYIAKQLGTRTHQLRLMMESNELVEAGKFAEAESLLNGSMTLDQLSESQLRSSNSSAARQTHPNGTEKTNDEVVKDTRIALQETINANRAGLNQLQDHISKLTDTIHGKMPEKPQDPLGLSPQSEAVKLTTDQKLQLMEQRNLLVIQQSRLREETERLFTAHDEITSATNTNDLSRARDIAEGRQSVLTNGKRLNRSASSLSERLFSKTESEKIEYQAAITQLTELQDTETQLSILMRGDAKNREGGLEAKISDTQNDINQSGILSSLGGRTEALRQTLGAEKANKKELKQLEDVVSKMQIQAKNLVTQGKYKEAESLLQSSNKAISDGFQSSNKKLLSAYQGVNKQLEQFDRKLKDSAVQGAKAVAITGVAAALAPATGGGSLAVLTALGTGTLAGIGVGVAIDSVDAAINMGAFDESFTDAASKVVSRENIYNNAKTAFSGALAGSSGAQIIAKLEKFGTVAATAGSAGGASALVTTINLTEQRIQAEKAYHDALQSDPNLNKDKFMEERGVNASQLAKAFTVDTSVGVLSGLVGLRAGSIKEAAKTGLTKGATEVGEEAASAVIGLAGAYVNDGELTAESIKDELMAATVGNRVARHASDPTRVKQETVDTKIDQVDSQPSKKNKGKLPKVIKDNFDNLMMASVLADPSYESEVTKSVYQDITNERQDDFQFDSGYIESKFDDNKFSFEINKENLGKLKESLAQNLEKARSISADVLSKNSDNADIRKLAYDLEKDFQGIRDPKQSPFMSAYEGGDIPVELKVNGNFSKADAVSALEHRLGFVDSVLKEGNRRTEQIISDQPDNPISLYYRDREELTSSIQVLREQNPEYADIIDMIKIPRSVEYQNGTQTNTSGMPSRKYIQKLVQSIQEVIPKHRLNELKEAGVKIHIGKRMSDADIELSLTGRDRTHIQDSEYKNRNTVDNHLAYSRGLNGIYLAENATGFTGRLESLLDSSNKPIVVREELAHSYERLLGNPDRAPSESSGFRTAILLDIGGQDNWDRSGNGYEIQLSEKGRFEVGAKEAFARPLEAIFEAETGVNRSRDFQEDFPRVFDWVNNRVDEHDRGIGFDQGQHNSPQQIQRDINSLTRLLASEQETLTNMGNGSTRESRVTFQRNFVEEIETTLAQRQEEFERYQ